MMRLTINIFFIVSCIIIVLGIFRVEKYIEFINQPAILIHRVDLPLKKYQICSHSKNMNKKMLPYIDKVYDAQIVTSHDVCDAQVSDALDLILKKQKNILCVLPFVKTCLVFSQQSDAKKIQNIYCSSDIEKKLAGVLTPTATVVRYTGKPDDTFLENPLNGILKYDYIEDIVEHTDALSNISFVDLDIDTNFLHQYPMAKYDDINLKIYFHSFNQRFTVKRVVNFHFVLNGINDLPERVLKNIFDSDSVVALNNYHTKFFNLSETTMQLLRQKNKHIMIKDTLPILEQYF